MKSNVFSSLLFIFFSLLFARTSIGESIVNTGCNSGTQCALNDIFGSTSSQIASTAKRTQLLYNVNIQGSATNSPNLPPKYFNLNGYLIIVSPGYNNDPRSTSGTNKVDAALVVGDPTGYAPTGSIEFATHTFWYAYKLKMPFPPIDLAYVSVTNLCTTLKPDIKRLTPAEQRIINTFSFLGATHLINAGSSINFCFSASGKSLSGSIQASGRHLTSTYASAVYSAKIKGYYRSAVTIK